MYQSVIAKKPRSWAQVENEWLDAMSAIDTLVAAGVADKGDWQNCKGDVFNDLLALILENCAQVELLTRHFIPGLIRANHNLDVTYPAEGVAQFLLEAKALGNPKHPGSEAEKDIGRRGSADVDKRVHEVAFKVIDLKLEYGRRLAEAGQSPETVPGGSLKSWLRGNKPTTYLFMSARVVSNTDLRALVRQADVAQQVVDGVGIFAFEPSSSAEPTKAYRSVTSDIPRPYQIDNVLYEACQELVGIKQRGQVSLAGPPSLAVEAQGLQGVEEDT